MNKVLLVLMGIMLILCFTLVAVQAGEKAAGYGKEKAAEAAGYGKEKATEAAGYGKEKAADKSESK